MIITLCGSARFEALFKAWNVGLTLAGHTVFSLSAYPSDMGKKNWYTDEEKRLLDLAHLRKINYSDAIFVINRFAYIGESTLREIEYAKAHGKLTYALESWGEGNGLCGMHNRLVLAASRAAGISDTGYSSSPIDTTTSAGFRQPWDLEFLGKAGPLRSKIIDIVQKPDWV